MFINLIVILDRKFDFLIWKLLIFLMFRLDYSGWDLLMVVVN